MPTPVKHRLAILPATLVALFLVPGSAPAYTNSTLSYAGAIVDTGNCEKLVGRGDATVFRSGDYCVSPDSADGTYFRRDVGGRAVKIMVMRSNTMLGKVEFHPYGEYLWVYDTYNDGDALYYTLEVRTNCSSCPGGFRWDVRGPYTAPGTSDRIDYRAINLSVADGTTVRVRVFDGAGMSDELFGWIGRA